MLPLKPVQGNVRRWILPSPDLHVDDNLCGSKLLAVDYVGVVLTLSGCALVILPLIWVRWLNLKFVASGHRVASREESHFRGSQE